MKKLFLCALCLLMLAGCGKGPRIQPIDSLTPVRTPKPVEETPTPTPAAIELPKPRFVPEGNELDTRYNPSLDFARQGTEAGTFSDFLQSLPLLADGAQVVDHNEGVREKDDYAAVIAIPVLNKNEQSAGAVAHLRAQYFYDKQEYDKIAFRLNDGFNFTFDKWSQGNKLRFIDGRASYTTGGTEGTDEENFHAYLTTYFAYSGLRSLREDLSEVDVADPVRIGDVFITGGDSPRIIVVADCAVDSAQNRHVLLIEGGKPAQPMRLLSNPNDSELSPWFVVDVANGQITVDEGTTLRVEPYDGGTPARYKFMTEAAGQEGEAP